MERTQEQHGKKAGAERSSRIVVEVRGKRVTVAPGSVIICGACSRAVPDHAWHEHRSTCLGLAEQMALLEELELDVIQIEIAEDLKKRLGARADIPLVPCSTCGAQPGELCVNAQARAMRIPHQRRRELIAKAELTSQSPTREAER